MRIVFKSFIVSYLSLYGMGTQFLTLPFSSQELSIGSHPTFSGHAPVNPALYQAYKEQPSIGINHGTWFGDVALTKIGYITLKNNELNHFGIKYSGLEDLEFRDNTPSDEPLAKFSAFGIAIDFGKTIVRENMRYGLSLSYVHFGLYTHESKGLGLNLGYALDFDNSIRLGASLLNIGRMNTLDNDTPLLPRRMLLGVSKDIVFNKFQNTVYGSIESNSIAPSAKIYLGNHLNYDRLNLYLGLSSSSEVIESSFGFGLYMNRFEIKYGIRLGSQNIGIPQIISIRFLLL